MSASLVGSEMCIRDRGPSLIADLRPRRCAAHKVQPRGLRRLSILRFSVSVSYTHLTLPTICSV
eukprot:9463001-Alexandrium_andersonii.AAC.1